MTNSNNWSPAAQRIFREACGSIQLWVNGPIDITLFQLMLQKQRQGVQVVLAMSEQKLNQLDITRQYLYNFQQAGGVILRATNDNKAQSYVLVDEDKLLLEHSAARKQVSQMAVVEEEQLLQKCQQHFTALKNKAVLPRLQTTDLKTAPPVQHSQGEERLFPATPIGLQINFWAEPEYVEIDETFELHWRVEGADRVDINCGIGAVAAQGCKVLSARKDATFVLEASNRWDTIRSLVQVNVNPAPKIRYRLTTFDHRMEEELPLTDLADFPHRYAVIRGQPVRLYWEVFNATTVEMEGNGPLSEEGFMELAPAQTAIYTIVATGEKEVVRQSIVLNVFGEVPALDQLWKQEKDEAGPAVNLEVDYPASLLTEKRPSWWKQEQAVVVAEEDTPPQHQRNWFSFIKKYLRNGR